MYSTQVPVLGACTEVTNHKPSIVHRHRGAGAELRGALASNLSRVAVSETTTCTAISTSMV